MILTLPRLTAPAGRVADGVGRYLDRLARRQRVVSRELDPRWLRQQRRKLRADGSLDIPRLALEARARGLAAMYGELFGRIIHRDGSVTNLGLLGRRVITDAGVAYLAADIGGGANDSNLFKFHGFGTGSTAESAAQTALVTELTTQYATDSTRPTGSQANSTNTYTTVATLSPDATVTITEHGIFTATSAGTMLDRTVFTGVALTGSADRVQATYVRTLPSGG
jgi:hypothetical protein